MWTTPVTRTDSAPRYRAACTMAGRCRVVKLGVVKAVVAGLALIRVSFQTRALVDQRGRDGPDRVARDREADTGRLGAAELGVSRRQRRDTDDPARQVDGRAPGVPGVDLRAGLDQSGELHVLRLRDVAVERGDDALGNARSETERVAHREDQVTDPDLVGVREPRRLGGRVGEMHHRDVVGRVGADDARGALVADRQRDYAPAFAVDDVRIR